MDDRRFYFSLGVATTLLIAMLVIGCSEPLEANSCEPGSAEWCPLYVKVIND